MACKRKKKNINKNPDIEKEYWEEIEIVNPKTGKIILQKVKITRYKAGPRVVKSSEDDDLIDAIEHHDYQEWD